MTSSGHRPAHRSAPRPAPRTTILTWVEAGLWLLSAACLGWVVWTSIEARLFQLKAAGLLHRAAMEDGSGAEADEAPGATPGTPLALLRIPRLGVSTVVAEGTSPRILRRAVGHLATSAPPGRKGREGHVVLAAHRDSFFRPLEGIRPGDRVILDTPEVSVVYTVEWTRIVEPSAVEVLADPGYPALTLITCFPFRYVGRAPLRFVVRTRRSGRSAALEVAGEDNRSSPAGP